MRNFNTSIAIDASPQLTWAVLIDFERWPEWTPSVLSIERLHSEAPGIGSQVRIRQPRMRPAIWTITDWRPDNGFVWVSRSPGVTVVAEHVIEATADGCVVRLLLRFDGLLGAVIGSLARSITERYLCLEAAGLKQRCEAVA